MGTRLTTYNVELDEDLFDISANEEVRLVRFVATFVTSKDNELAAKRNVIEAAKIQSAIAKILFQLTLPRDVLLPELMRLCKAICPHQTERFEAKLLAGNSSPESMSIASQVMAMLNSVPTDGEGIVVLPQEERQEVSVKLPRRRVYKLSEKVSKAIDAMDDIVNGLDEFAHLRDEAAKIVRLFDGALEEDYIPEYREGMIEKLAFVVQGKLMDVLRFRRKLLIILRDSYEVSSAIAFLSFAISTAETFSAELASAIRLTYPALGTILAEPRGIVLSRKEENPTELLSS